MLLLTFQAAGQRYAVDAKRVVEVVPRVRARPLPHAPAHLTGVFEYRGEVVTVVDLGMLLGSTAAPDRLSTRIILIDRGGAAPDRRELLGLVAEHVDDLTPVDPAALAPIPTTIPNAPYLGGIAETNSGMIQLLLVDKVLDAPTTSDRREVQ
ncbi:chemotaxis protein CheW [Paludisphaera rhizosphaerae]|uniref:chemotaxis protein CheW n=1 Tax=Paludisphaera rhizosphaerae TaxID=2711216 RepID=UPI0013EB91C1|nr:chemotaxis protein CheW [Paludisphaera rhizosphaerae]